MDRSVVAGAALSAVLLASGSAFAQTAAPPAATAPAAPAPEEGAKALGVPVAAPRGFYLEMQLGAFISFGGAQGYSNAQPFEAIQLGFDIPGFVPGQTVNRWSIFFTGGHGSNDGDCHVLETGGGGGCLTWNLPNNAQGQSAENFSVIPLELGTRIGFDSGVDRLVPYAEVVAGYTLFSPQLSEDSFSGGPHVGLGGGVEYETYFEGLTVGAEVLIRAAFASGDGISVVMPYFTGYGRLQYTF